MGKYTKDIMSEYNLQSVKKGLRNPTLVIHELPALVGTFYRATIRRAIPTAGYAEWNGVQVPESVAPKQRYFDTRLPYDFHQANRRTNEGGEVNAHRQYTNRGDDVVIVGGGRGVTTVIAADQAGLEGSVLTYEGSRRYSDIVSETVRINNVDDRCEVVNAVVGSPIDVYDEDDPDRLDVVPHDELPDCDVLELDCEGAEVGILRELKITPRVIVVEVHPRKYPDEIHVVEEQLAGLGYEIVDRFSNDGQRLSERQFEEVLSGHVTGDAHAPVLVASTGDEM